MVDVSEYIKIDQEVVRKPILKRLIFPGGRAKGKNAVQRPVRGRFAG